MIEEMRRVPWTVSDAIVALIWFMVVVTAGEYVVALLLGHILSVGAQIAALFIGYLGLLGILYYVAISERGANWWDLGLRRFNVLTGIGAALLWFFLTKVLAGLYAFGAERLGIKESNAIAEQLPKIFGTNKLGFFLALIVVGFMAPIVEELFFRGFFYGVLREKIGVAAGMLVSSLLFALFHFSLYMFIPILIIGLSLAYLYETTDSLGPPILLHGLNNIVSVVLLYYSKSFLG